MRKEREERILAEARDRFETAEEWERDNRKLAEEDFAFAAGRQWPDNVESQRQAEGKPCLTINRLPQFISQVVGDARQNKPAIKVHGVDEEADQETAEVYEGLIRHIEYASQAQTAYLTAFEHCVTGSVGHWRISTKQDRIDPFVQNICIDPVQNPLSVFWDIDARKYDKSDANWCFVVEEISKKAFKARYPKEVPSDWGSAYTGIQQGWATAEKVRIAEYWVKVPKKKNIALMQDGRRVEWDQVDPNEYMMIAQVAEVESFDVTRYVICGHCILEGPEVFPGQYIPVVPVMGPEEYVDGRIRYRSLIRYAKDPQRMYNYWQSTITEKVALAPKAQFIGTLKQFKGLERFWNAANTENRAYLPFNPDPEFPTAPQRQQPAAVNAAELQQAAQAIDDLKATMGMYDASLGNRSNEQSGRAIIARQREGDTATFAWIDNLSRSIEHTGRILVEIIPSIFDTTRVVRVLGEDGDAEMTPINAPMMTPEGPRLVNDLTTGKYDVTVSVGPSYATRRIEAADSMMAFMQAVPQAGQVAADLVAKSMDWPGAEMIAERLKRALPPGIVEEAQTPEQQQQQAQQQEQQNAMMAMQMQGAKAETDVKQADARKKNAEAEQTELETAMQMSMRDSMTYMQA